MKGRVLSITFLMIGFLGLCANLLFAEGHGNFSSPPYSGERSIAVIGEGKVISSPDAAVINIGVETLDFDVQTANAKANTLMDSILSVLYNMEIEKQNIQTSNFSIWLEPNYRRFPEDPEIPTSGQYHVSNMIKITVSDIDNVASIIDSVVKAGANRIWGVNFIRKDLSLIHKEARVAAMQDAEKRAMHLAELAGVQLGEILHISENTDISYPSSEYGGGGTSLSPGELEYTFRVRVIYKIE